MLEQIQEEIRNKSECPPDCPFYSDANQPVIIPLPKEIKGIVISREPRMEWNCIYNYAKSLSNPIDQRRVLYASAIPNQLCERVSQFAERDCTDTQWDKFYQFIFEKTYWTHFHKCFTKSGNEYSHHCSRTWLTQEIDACIDRGAEVLITLGRDTQRWARRAGAFHKLKVISLFHPTPQVNHVWAGLTSSRSQFTETRREIGKLLDYLELPSL